MIRFILFILLATLSLFECHYWDNFGYNYGYGYSRPQYWQSFLQYPPKRRPYNLRKSLPQQNIETYFDYKKQPSYNGPKDSVETLVDQVIEIDKKIKSICNRGHNPSEEITEENYKRIFNVKGYKTETATVKIKHTVLYTCVDSVSRGRPCLEDIALLPENLNVENASYSIENYNLIVTIPFKSNSVFKESDVCKVGDINEREIIVSKKQTVETSYYRFLEALRKRTTQV